MSPSEQIILELSEMLTEEWYNAEDWGEDKFTLAMAEASDQNQTDFANKIFEASVYFVMQELFYGETGSEVLKRLNEIKNAPDA